MNYYLCFHTWRAKILWKALSVKRGCTTLLKVPSLILSYHEWWVRKSKTVDMWCGKNEMQRTRDCAWLGWGDERSTIKWKHIYTSSSYLLGVYFHQKTKSLPFRIRINLWYNEASIRYSNFRNCSFTLDTLNKDDIMWVCMTIYTNHRQIRNIM